MRARWRRCCSVYFMLLFILPLVSCYRVNAPDKESRTGSDAGDDRLHPTDTATLTVDTTVSSESDSYVDAGTRMDCVVYVKQGLAQYTGHRGDSWENAFEHVQEGLDEAKRLLAQLPDTYTTCDVWVAAGVYRPTAFPVAKDDTDSSAVSDPSDPRRVTFQLVPHVRLTGGFAGNETEVNQRDIEAAETILSCDLLDNDTADFPSSDDNCYHVLIGADDAVIDGFTITGGHSDENSIPPDDRGAGMYNENVSPTVVSCTFIGNRSGTSGGGVYNNAASNSQGTPRFSDCTFSNNIASSDSGGAMFNFSSSPVIERCVFDGNVSDSGGAVANVIQSSPEMTDCIFTGNTAHSSGGVLYNSDSSSALMTGCTFSLNAAQIRGGAFYNIYYSSPTVMDSVFTSNSVSAEGESTYGGVLYNANASSPLFIHCLFVDSSASAAGDSSIASHGGVAHNVSYSSPTFVGCDFIDSTAGYGGLMYNDKGSSPVITNSIVWKSSAGLEGSVLYNREDSFATITYSLVEGGCTVASGCTADETGNIDGDPQFTDIDGGDFSLTSVSPAIDVGSNAVQTEDLVDWDNDEDVEEYLSVYDYIIYDAVGHTRIVDGDPTDNNTVPTVDIGAVEYQTK